ncbi:ABC transporter ATP-binding protein [Ktedonospora formicarum]|uniref:Cobalt ABC transporter ATP-binding protein n=1 Tax=Ktedonospora formicarum TaxID=2778364 RepID=A0A8J3I5S8_9CHLR|nr:energy-coupling factor transporter ATPase [Ktedonospora formicarum]GHO46413.1 cobalt ABC transporter ATP-binding protein [Ktedonospora formicarum]
MISALSISGLWWRYPHYGEKAHPWTLRDITLQIQPGECFGITGPSGAGKTTLCRLLMGILPYSARLSSEQLRAYFRGTLQLLGEPITEQTTSSHKVGMIMQDPENQFLRMSLLHELGIGLQIQGVPNDEIVERARAALSWVGLEHLWHGAIYTHPADLSGGQKQRVAIAAFLAMRPQVLILDEPTSDLDPVGKREVIETIARLRHDYQITVILVEQDPEILSAFCDRIALLHEGRVELVAPPTEFYSYRDVLEQCGASVGELTRLSWQSGRTIEGHLPLTLDEAEEVYTPLLTASSELSTPVLRAPEEPVVSAKGVEYRYGDGTLALKGIDMSLRRGEMLALLGPNGSGKTTFAKILAGIYRTSGGRVEVLGKDLARRRARSELPAHVGYVFQNPDHQLFCRTVSDEIEYGLKNVGMPGGQRREVVKDTLEAVDLAQYADEDPLFLSKGQRQRLAVAAVLAMGPEILIVDEPTTGQDFRSVSSIMRLLRTLQEQGKTILVITHDMTLVAEYCQRAIAFRDGQVVFNGTPGELFSEERALKATGLRAPASAALSIRLRQRNPYLPRLITVDQWREALRCSDPAL